ncbi:glycosyltransferase [Chitinophaga sp. 212800010-3]|uniref:glycosyltransferase n=1 Tax=unclassified Chitinophaga TaxID=2619133 RepID=UPI002DF56796|nr:hypothetical protein [Chitinophaga sp. 212800010-3]
MKTVLVFCRFYLPGFKCGGPLRTIENVVDQLKGQYSFKIVTSDHDLGETEKYKNILTDAWNNLNGHVIFYISVWKLRKLREIISESKCDYIYLNGLFDFQSTIKVLLLKRLRLITVPVILATRGELSPHALKLRRFKKILFLSIAKMAGLYKDVLFQASSEFEKKDITIVLGNNRNVRIASDLPRKLSIDTSPQRNKFIGNVKFVSVSRIVPVKNIHHSISLLKDLEGQIEFDIYGPIEDLTYWEKCKEEIKKIKNKRIAIAYKGTVKNEDVYDVLKKYHFLYFMTTTENFGHIIYEALSMGCPTLISDRTPWQDLEEYKAGWVLPLDKQEKIRKTLQQCIDMSETEYRNLSDAAFAYSKDFFDRTGVLADNLNLFR